MGYNDLKILLNTLLHPCELHICQLSNEISFFPPLVYQVLPVKFSAVSQWSLELLFIFYFYDLLEQLIHRFYFHMLIPLHSGSQSLASGPAASVSLRNLLEVQILGCHLRTTKSETQTLWKECWLCGQAVCFNRLNNSDACTNLESHCLSTFLSYIPSL